MAKGYYRINHEFPEWVGERFKDEAGRRAEIEGYYTVARLVIDYARTLPASAKEGEKGIPGPNANLPAVVPRKSAQPQGRKRAKRTRKAPGEPENEVA